LKFKFFKFKFFKFKFFKFKFFSLVFKSILKKNHGGDKNEKELSSSNCGGSSNAG